MHLKQEKKSFVAFKALNIHISGFDSWLALKDATFSKIYQIHYSV